ncbi:hypothetical protein Droror1_Dr00009985 [Drosera rotundifolia]
MAMATILVMLLFILGSISMVAMAQEEVFKKPAPTDTWYGQPLPSQPRPGYYKFLGDCIDKTTKACGLKISKAIFENGKLNDPLCCKKVVEAGFLCNRSLSFILALFDKFKPQAVKIHKNGDAIYDQCKANAPHM